MDINPFIQTAFGTVRGGCVVIITNKLAERSIKRKNAQEWYEKFYIEEGINPLIIYFKRLQLYAKRTDKILPVVKTIEEAPIDATTRMEAFLHKDYFTNIILFVHPCIISESEPHRKAALKAVNDSLNILYGLRIALLQTT